MALYDAIADAYSDGIASRDERGMVLVPTAIHYVGDVTGKRLLDLACGNGYYARIFKALGASEVTGVDISAEMIGIAKARNDADVRYSADDVASMGSSISTIASQPTNEP